MSQADSDRDWNVYTALALVSCASLIVACTLLFMELQKYPLN